VAIKPELHVVGVSVARKNEIEKNVLKKYVEAYGESIGKNLELKSINLTDDYICGGYGKYTPELIKTIREMYISNGIPLDPTYTGKAFYGMIDMLQKGMLGNKQIKPSENVLFIHTGGTPLFFDNIREIF
jgi:D-cysteine desulfhydrase